MITMRTLLLLTFFYSLLFSKEIETIKLQLQWKHQFEFAGFYAAKEKGFYKEVGLDVEFVEFDSKMKIVDEVLNGNAEYGLTYSTLIADYMKGKPLLFVSNFFKQSPLVLVTQKDIQTPADLKGKKVMGLLDSTHKQIILTMLDKFNLTENDFTNVSRKFSIQSFANKEVDALSIFTTNEIYTLDKMGVQYNILDPAAFGTKFYDLNLFTTKNELKNHPTRVENFKNASIKGWKYALENKEEIADLIIQKYNTQNKSKEALLFEAKQIEYLMLTNVYPIGSIDIERIQTISDSFAHSLLLQKKSKEELETFIYKPHTISLELNQEQTTYLENKKNLKMCVDPKWMPLEGIEEGKHVGIAADFMYNISQKIKIPIQLIQTEEWTQSLNKIEKRECDILALAEETPLRKKYLNFTTPYIKTPLVIATKIGLPFMDNLNTIQNKRLGIVKNYSTEELLKTKYPNINLITVDSIQEGLKQVQEEKIFGFLDNSIVINHEIQKNHLKDIVISGQFPNTLFLSIASRNDEPLLHEILEKALLSIDKETKNSILNRWNNINFQLQTDYHLIFQIALLTFVLICIFIYWNLKLKKEIKLKESVQKQLQQSEEKFRTLFNIAPVLLNSFNSKGHILLWNKECERVFGWTYEEIKQQENPIELFYPNKKDQKRFLDTLSLNYHNTYQLWYPKTKYGTEVITKWANIHLPNGDIIHIGYDVTKEKKDALAMQEKTEQLKIATEKLEKLNNNLEKEIQKEVEKNAKNQLILLEKNRLAQMGEMIENIAHQWRQPLCEINSLVLLIDQKLSQQNICDDAIETNLSGIESLTYHMSKTIDNFKNFFNPQKEQEQFFLNEAIQQALLIVKGTLEHNYINVKTTVSKELQCKSYSQALQEVLLVIINNARDALIQQKITQPEIHIKVKKLQEVYVLIISDNAKGIPKAYLGKIFEPYFTTKHKKQGTGIGLYMAKTIVEEALKGKLLVKNTKKGASFRIIFPKGEIDD